MHAEFQSFDMRGRRLRYVCRGEGAPTILVEQGGGISIEAGFEQHQTQGWPKVFASLARRQRTFMHDRAGLGWSYEPRKPRSCGQLVKDLRALLRYAQVGPPYLLVGHSIGGFNVRLFATQYPEEVAGVVLVDSTHPDQWTRFRRLVPRPTAGEPVGLQSLRQKPDPSLTPELIDYAASADEVRTAGALGDTPLVVLSRSPNALRPSGLPADLAAGIEEVWSGLQRDLLNLSTRSTQVVATHAGHHMQLDEPYLVIRTVLELLRQTSRPRLSVH
jgi:pimeloyl-ACP methyl ester carboxylesterase